jgi:hypothetical protein
MHVMSALMEALPPWNVLLAIGLAAAFWMCVIQFILSGGAAKWTNRDVDQISGRISGDW